MDMRQGGGAKALWYYPWQVLTSTDRFWASCFSQALIAASYPSTDPAAIGTARLPPPHWTGLQMTCTDPLLPPGLTGTDLRIARPGLQVACTDPTANWGLQAANTDETALV